MADFPQNIYNFIDETQGSWHAGAILDTNKMLKKLGSVKSLVEIWYYKNKITDNDDTYDVTKRAYNQIFPDENVAILRPNARLNLLYPKQYFEGQGIKQPKWVADGANMLANEWYGLELGLLRDEGYTEAKLEDLKKTTVGENLIHQTLEFVGADDLAGRWEQKVLDDVKKGNAENMFTQLIPMSQGRDGYWVAVFWYPPGSSPENADLVGGMLNKGKLHEVSKEQLVGASISEHLLQYVQSWYFDYNHENIRNLYNKGREEGSTKDHGWWNPEGGYFNKDREFENQSKEGDWMMDNMRRALHFLTTEVGDTEFKYAVKPLYDMMGRKLEEINSKLPLPERRDNLDEEESQDILREYMDTLDRTYKRRLKNEPLSWLKVPARWISNFYELDLNPRELWNWSYSTNK
jgi:hypothetical protein|tara:strand:+ start:2594 stop:3811 length:1218 start_codon:yes stop_codon:yes gene_type:complete